MAGKPKAVSRLFLENALAVLILIFLVTGVIYGYNNFPTQFHTFLDNIIPCSIAIVFLVLAISFIFARIRENRSSASIRMIIPFIQEEGDSWLDDILPDDYTG
jgi:ABC-type multidrug transport system permease subunit